jgi:hypothetical protein
MTAKLLAKKELKSPIYYTKLMCFSDLHEIFRLMSGGRKIGIETDFNANFINRNRNSNMTAVKIISITDK